MLHGDEDPDLTEIRSSTIDKVDFHDPRAVRYVSPAWSVHRRIHNEADADQTADRIAAEAGLWPDRRPSPGQAMSSCKLTSP